MTVHFKCLFDARPRGRMKYAKLENSERLQRTLAVLQRGGKFTTRELMREADICAVNTAIDELRENGFDIQCARVRGVWFYHLVGQAKRASTCSSTEHSIRSSS